MQLSFRERGGERERVCVFAAKLGNQPGAALEKQNKLDLASVSAILKGRL